jgi:hypothetical protein
MNEGSWHLPGIFIILSALQPATRVRSNSSVLRQGLAMWRYSVLRKPGLVLIKDMKMKIFSIAGLYSSVGYIAE